MPSNYFFVFLLSLFFLNCNTQEEIKVVVPDTIISESEMALILADIHLAEAKTKFLKRQQGTQIKEADDLSFKENVFKNHHIEKKQFEESLNFYSQHPQLFELVYEKTITTLEEGKIKADTIKTQ